MRIARNLSDEASQVRIPDIMQSIAVPDLSGGQVGGLSTPVDVLESRLWNGMK